MKKTVIHWKVCTLVFLVLALALVVPTACARAEFQLSSLKISPSTVGTGDTATVEVDVANVGNGEGIYTAALTIDGVPVETKDVTVSVGATQKVTFVVSKQVAGMYTVGVGDLSEVLHVAKPAEFQLSSLMVTPSEIVLGNEATAAVDVRNIGELEGDYTCALLVAGTKVQPKKVTLVGGATETVSFSFVPEEHGPCQVTVGDLTETIKVLKPAEFKVTSLVVPSEPVEATSRRQVTVEIENVGEAEGTYTAELKVDGERVETRDVTLRGGEKREVSFGVSMDKQGTYEITADGLHGTLQVVPLPMSSAVLVRSDFPGGFGPLTLAELGMTLDELTEDTKEWGVKNHHYFAFMSGRTPATYELVFGVISHPMTTSGQVMFNMELSKPDTFLKDYEAGLRGPGVKVKCELLQQFNDIGDKSIGVRTDHESEGVAQVIDVIMFRRDDVVIMLTVAWFEGHDPVVPSDKITRMLDSRLAKVLATR